MDSNENKNINIENEENKESVPKFPTEISEIEPNEVKSKDKEILIHSQIIIKYANNDNTEIEKNEQKIETNEEQYSKELPKEDEMKQTYIVQNNDEINNEQEVADHNSNESDEIENNKEPKEDEMKHTYTVQNNDEINNEQEVADHNSNESDEIENNKKSKDELKSSNENIDTIMEASQNILVNVDIKNTSLGFLQSQYSNSGSESDSDTDSSDSEPIVVNDQGYRDQVVEIDSDGSSDSEVELVHEEIKKKIMEFEANDEEEIDDDENNCPKKRSDPLRVKGELLLHELPPIQDLQITVPEDECVLLGKIHSVVEQLVLVNSIPETVPLNLDTVLFLDKGQKVLGEIFDVLGQVTCPLYCVRFNSKKQIEEKGIEIGQDVYVAPRTEHTQFVILSEIMKVRGSDASWKNDVEPSASHIDFSDDEEERNYRRRLGNKEHNNKPDENSNERKRSRTFSSTSSQMSDSSAMTSPMSNYGQGFNNRGRGNNRFPRGYRQQYNQFQPRNRPVYNNARLQAPPNYNYDQFNNSWHSNYNFNSNYQPLNFPQSHSRSNQYMDQSYYNGNYQNFNMHGQNSVQPQPSNYNNVMQPNSSLIYPNPYAIRNTFIPSQNPIEQPLFMTPPPPPPQN